MNSTTTRFWPFLVIDTRIKVVNYIDSEWFRIVSVKNLIVTSFLDTTGEDGNCRM